MQTVSRSFLGLSIRQWYNLFKYSIYALLVLNTILFLQEELLAADHSFSSGVPLFEYIIAFSTTIDTGSWVILLVMFELETYVIDDNKLKGGLQWTLHGLRGICYLFIAYSFYGYIGKTLPLYGFGPSDISNLCSTLNWSFMIDLDDYVDITAANCQALAAGPYLQMPNTDILTTADIRDTSTTLAWTDVLNAATWLLVVVVLEIDVWVQTRHSADATWLTVNKWIKSVLYSILFICAAYWGIDGSFLDFWDAFLWLVAFVFIEMNIFEWQEELQGKPSRG